MCWRRLRTPDGRKIQKDLLVKGAELDGISSQCLNLDLIRPASWSSGRGL